MKGKYGKKKKRDHHPNVPVSSKEQQSDSATNNSAAQPKHEVETVTQEKPKNSWIPGATLFVAVIVAIIYFCQLRAMVKSNEINRTSLQSIQRAFVTFRVVDGVRRGNPDQTDYGTWRFVA